MVRTTTIESSRPLRRTMAFFGVVIALSIVACSSADDPEFDDPRSPLGGSSAGAPVSGGSAITAGALGSGARSGADGGTPSSGRAGSANPSSGGANVSGGVGGTGGSGGATPTAGSPGAGGRGSGGRSAGGGMAGSSGGSPSASGSGGSAGGCTENLTCKLAALPSTGDPAQDCVDRINQFRTQCACLPPLARWTEGEDCADQHAEYDSTREAHSGFSDRICDKGGSSQNECPGYRSTTDVISVCLQQMWNEGPPPENPCEDDCFQEYGHFINMTSTRSTKVACGFFTTQAGKTWSVQNFSR